MTNSQTLLITQDLCKPSILAISCSDCTLRHWLSNLDAHWNAWEAFEHPKGLLPTTRDSYFVDMRCVLGTKHFKSSPEDFNT